MRRKRPLIVVGVFAVLALACTFAACTLNPQPLPPSDFNGASAAADDAGTADSGAFSPTGAVDAAAPGPAVDGGGTGNDGDGGDAGADAGGDAATDGGDGGDGG